MIRYADFLLGLKSLYLPTVFAIKRAFPLVCAFGTPVAGRTDAIAQGYIDNRDAGGCATSSFCIDHSGSLDRNLFKALSKGNAADWSTCDRYV